MVSVQPSCRLDQFSSCGHHLKGRCSLVKSLCTLVSCLRIMVFAEGLPSMPSAPDPKQAEAKRWGWRHAVKPTLGSWQSRKSYFLCELWACSIEKVASEMIQNVWPSRGCCPPLTVNLRGEHLGLVAKSMTASKRKKARGTGWMGAWRLGKRPARLTACFTAFWIRLGSCWCFRRRSSWGWNGVIFPGRGGGHTEPCLALWSAAVCSTGTR